MSITKVENASRATRFLAQTTLRNVLGTRSLSEILSEREAISHNIQVKKYPPYLPLLFPLLPFHFVFFSCASTLSAFSPFSFSTFSSVTFPFFFLPSPLFFHPLFYPSLFFPFSLTHTLPLCPIFYLRLLSFFHLSPLFPTSFPVHFPCYPLFINSPLSLPPSLSFISNFTSFLQVTLEGPTRGWGVQVQRVEV